MLSFSFLTLAKCLRPSMELDIRLTRLCQGRLQHTPTTSSSTGNVARFRHAIRRGAHHGPAYSCNAFLLVVGPNRSDKSNIIDGIDLSDYPEHQERAYKNRCKQKRGSIGTEDFCRRHRYYCREEYYQVLSRSLNKKQWTTSFQPLAEPKESLGAIVVLTICSLGFLRPV